MAVGLYLAELGVNASFVARTATICFGQCSLTHKRLSFTLRQGHVLEYTYGDPFILFDQGKIDLQDPASFDQIADLVRRAQQ